MRRIILRTSHLSLRTVAPATDPHVVRERSSNLATELRARVTIALPTGGGGFCRLPSQHPNASRKLWCRNSLRHDVRPTTVRVPAGRTHAPPDALGIQPVLRPPMAACSRPWLVLADVVTIVRIPLSATSSHRHARLRIGRAERNPRSGRVGGSGWCGRRVSDALAPFATTDRHRPQANREPAQTPLRIRLRRAYRSDGRPPLSGATVEAFSPSDAAVRQPMGGMSFGCGVGGFWSRTVFSRRPTSSASRPSTPRRQSRPNSSVRFY